ncbi:MAG: GNAT family acetyltransferase [Porticoccaceae bacterium]|nr:GNAT family acetyltransferase [Porticoccaceae bacterium]
MTAKIDIHCVRGSAIGDWIPTLAQLRIAVFREFPYLYDGTIAYEEKYLQTYVNSATSIAVLAMANGEVIGASTGLALADEDPAFIQPFIDKGYNVGDIFYCAESVLLPDYRGMGVYKYFFNGREAHARSLPAIKTLAFCAVQRPLNHPLRPANYVPLDDIWRRFGYCRRPELATTFHWKDVDEVESSAKAMVFYTKQL